MQPPVRQPLSANSTASGKIGSFCESRIDRDTAAAGHFLSVSEETEPRHVRAGVHGELAHDFRRLPIERRHGHDGGANAAARHVSSFEGRRDDSGAERLREHEGITSPYADIADHAGGMHDACDGHAELRLRIDDAVATDDDGPSFSTRSAPPLRMSPRMLQVQFAFGKGHDVQRRPGLRSHCVDVAQRVCRRDLTEGIRVVDNGREEIDGVDNGQVPSKAEYPGVVIRFGADDYIGVLESWQAAQDLLEVCGTELGGTTCRRDLLGETDPGNRVDRRAGTFQYVFGERPAEARTLLPKPSHVPDSNGEPFAVEILQQRDRVLATRAKQIAESGWSNVALLGQMLI